jgi:hypothetical protein
MGRFAFFLIIADIVLTAAALISCLSTEDEDIRGLPRLVWVLIILFFSPVGAIAWFVAGRDRAAMPRRQTAHGPAFPRPNVPRGPWRPTTTLTSQAPRSRPRRAGGGGHRRGRTGDVAQMGGGPPAPGGRPPEEGQARRVTLPKT